MAGSITVIRSKLFRDSGSVVSKYQGYRWLLKTVVRGLTVIYSVDKGKTWFTWQDSLFYGTVVDTPEGEIQISSESTANLVVNELPPRAGIVVESWKTESFLLGRES